MMIRLDILIPALNAIGFVPEMRSPHSEGPHRFVLDGDDLETLTVTPLADGMADLYFVHMDIVAIDPALAQALMERVNLDD